MAHLVQHFLGNLLLSNPISAIFKTKKKVRGGRVRPYIYGLTDSGLPQLTLAFGAGSKSQNDQGSEILIVLLEKLTVITTIVNFFVQKF